jgi:DNA transformation protein
MEKGSREAWLAIRATDPSACYNRLCGLEGAIRGIRWHDLDEDTKAELKAFYQVNKK